MSLILFYAHTRDHLRSVLIHDIVARIVTTVQIALSELSSTYYELMLANALRFAGGLHALITACPSCSNCDDCDRCVKFVLHVTDSGALS